MADLITLSDWQIQRGITPAANAQESMLISQCSAHIEEFCGRTFAQASYTEILSGNGTPYQWLKNRPLTATGLRVYEDNAAAFGQASGAFPSTSELTIGTDFALPPDQPDGLTSRSGLLLRLNGIWRLPPSYLGLNIAPVNLTGIGGNLKVTYTAGYATVPLDVQQACMLLCASVKAMAKLGQAVQAETDETYSYQLRPLIVNAFAGMPPEVLGRLARYRNYGFG